MKLRHLPFLALMLVPAPAAALELEEPRAGLHLDVAGACLVKPPGDPACASFAASAHQSERFAVVLHDGTLLSFSVAMFATEEPGEGEERARRVVKGLGDADAPTLVTYGGESFLRVDLHPQSGAAVCFVTVDARPSLGIVMFASEPGLADAMRTHADETMRTVRRLGAMSAPPPAPPMALWKQAALTLLAAFVFGMPMVRFIRLRRDRRRRR